MQREHEVEKRIVNWAIIIPGVIAILTAAWFAFAFGVRVAMWPVEQQVHEVQRTLDGQGKDIVEIKQTLKIHVDTDISETTNASPSFTPGVTVPRIWFPVTNNGAVYYVPGY